MRWYVRFRKKKPWWRVSFLHSTDSSSWWGEDFIEADSEEEALRKFAKTVDIKEHTSYRDGYKMRVRVYGPIPQEYTEFKIGEDVSIEPQEG